MLPFSVSNLAGFFSPAKTEILVDISYLKDAQYSRATGQTGRLVREMTNKSKFSYDELEKPNKFLRGDFTVMFVDVVKFTKFGDNDAFRRVVRELQNAIIDVFEKLEWDLPGKVTQNDAVMIPTGDGYGIGFEPDRVLGEEVLRYATEFSNRLRDSHASVRMGINSGPCFVHKDVNTKLNLCGWGVIEAERAMSCGNANHILCTASFAKPIIQAKAEPQLHPIGKRTAKGSELELYNFYSDDFGNKTTPPGGKSK